MIAKQSISAWSSEQSKIKRYEIQAQKHSKVGTAMGSGGSDHMLELSGWSKVPLIAQQECKSKRRLVDHLVAVLTKQIAVDSPPKPVTVPSLEHFCHTLWTWNTH